MSTSFRQLTPRYTMAYSILRWEGKWQAMATDPGNYLNGILIGTMYGVTPGVARDYFGVSDSVVTAEWMQRMVTPHVAADIAVNKYYKGYFDMLVWNPATDVILDHSWGCGPGQAIKSTERDVLGLQNADFKFDNISIVAYDRFVNADIEKAVRRIFDVREAFYDLICDRNESLRMFRQGWHNRAASQLPNTKWWAMWTGSNMPPDVIDATDRRTDTLPRALLSKGMIGHDVAILQEYLNRALPEEQPLEVDGIFGEATDTAVRRVQEMAEITVDGWVGNQTRSALGMEV